MPGQDCLCTPVGSNLQVNRLGRFVTRPPSLDLFRPTVVIGSSLFFFFCGLKASSHLCPSSPIKRNSLPLFLILYASFSPFPRLFLFDNRSVINFAIGRSSFVRSFPFCCTLHYYVSLCIKDIYSRAIILDDQERPRVRI